MVFSMVLLWCIIVDHFVGMPILYLLANRPNVSKRHIDDDLLTIHPTFNIKEQ